MNNRFGSNKRNKFIVLLSMVSIYDIPHEQIYLEKFRFSIPYFSNLRKLY
jgi:hypothetical protein